MKILSKQLSFVLLALCAPMIANEYRGEYRDENASCCPLPCESRCSVNCGNPLNCGEFDIQFQGGFDPIVWKSRQYLNAILCPPPGTTPTSSVIIPLIQIPKQHFLYKYPWIVGAQIGYALSDDIRVYGEFNYIQSRAKSGVTIPIPVSPTASIGFGVALGKYRLYDAYAGLRYYSDRWCGRTSFFIGGKVGLVHHRAVNFSISEPTPGAPLVIVNQQPLFFSNTAVSGGVNVGLDICLACNFSLVLTGEFVASCGPSTNSDLFITDAVSPTIPFNSLLIGRIGTELRFPITAGIRYSF